MTDRSNRINIGIYIYSKLKDNYKTLTQFFNMLTVEDTNNLLTQWNAKKVSDVIRLREAGADGREIIATFSGLSWNQQNPDSLYFSKIDLMKVEQDFIQAKILAEPLIVLGEKYGLEIIVEYGIFKVFYNVQ